MVHTRRRFEKQQIIIPKGLLGPNDVAVIEIPRRYKRLPVIIAKRQSGSRPEERAEELFLDTNNGRNSIRKAKQVPYMYVPTNTVIQQPLRSTESTYFCQPQSPVLMPEVPDMYGANVSSYSIYSIATQTPIQSIQPISAPRHNQYQFYVQPACIPPATSYGNIDLIEKERAEKDLVRRSLEEFQEARRKFLKNANSLAGKLKARSKTDNDESSSSE